MVVYWRDKGDNDSRRRAAAFLLESPDCINIVACNDECILHNCTGRRGTMAGVGLIEV